MRPGRVRSRSPALASLLALGLAVAAAALPGCATENRRALAQRGDGRPALVGGESPDDVRARWGEPDEVFEARDAATGAARTSWRYDRFVDVGGRRLETTVHFLDGRAVRIDERAGHEDVSPATRTRDSSWRRDMDW